MDAESLSQIERIVTAATDGLRREMTEMAGSLREEMGFLEARLGDRIDASRQEVEARLGDRIDASRQEVEARLGDRIDASRQEVEARLGDRIDASRQEVEARLGDRIEDAKRHMESRLDDRFEESKRYMGVIAEGLRHNVQLVAEACQLQSERLEEFRQDVAREARETRALIQLTYGQIQQRVENLERRV